MSLTKDEVRKILKTANVDDEHMDDAVNAIISGNVASIEGLRNEISTLKSDVAKYKADADKLADVQKELNGLREKSKGNDYESLKAEFDKYKQEQENKATKAKKEKAFRDVLKNIGVDDAFKDDICKIADIDGIEFDDNGKIKDAEAYENAAKDKWKSFIVKTSSKGAETSTPPKNNGGKMTKEEIMKISDTQERQAKIAENHELFGI